jgi:hypothetical protein
MPTMNPLASWGRYLVDGGVLLAAREDVDLGVIRIRTGLPLRPVRQVVDDLVAPGFGGAKFEPFAQPRRFATAEREHAALFELVARPPGREMRRAVCVVVGDHEVAVIDGRALRPEGYDIAAKVEHVARHFAFGLGTDRWRRCFYNPPKGWHGVPRYRADVWLPPDYPANDGVLTVFHARPVDIRVPIAQHEAIFEQVSGEYGQAEPIDRQVMQLPSGLTGEAVTRVARLDGETRQATTVAVGHAGWLHLVRLETEPAHVAVNVDALKTLLLSIEPVPSVKQAADALNQWSE